jgi:hypothetical protein
MVACGRFRSFMVVYPADCMGDASAPAPNDG